MKQIGNLKIEWGETTFVATYLGAVQINVREVIGCTEIGKHATVGRSLIIEGFLIPDGSLVKEESLPLAIPVAGNAERFRSVEVVFDKFAFAFWLCVFEETVVGTAGIVRIDYDFPLSIQTDRSPAADILD